MTRLFQLHVIVPALLMLSQSQAPAERDLSERAVVAAATAYVKDYQDQLTSVLADEIYRQEIVRRVPDDPNTPRTRTLASEVFFMFAPGGGWMAIRDVIRVDDRTIVNRGGVLDALRTSPTEDVAWTFKTYNSRFNLGRTFRNFNEPTLPLLVLDSEHRDRFSFDRKRIERTADGVLVVLAFKERERPTLIRDMRHGAVFSEGELAVEPGTGRIRRTLLTAKVGPVRLELLTAYASDERLGILVPTSFRERYEHGTAPRSLEAAFEYEEIHCEAVYSNYRRFETAVRIK